MNKKNVILFSTHILTNDILERFFKLSDSLSCNPYMDVILLYHNQNKYDDSILKSMNCYSYTYDDLNQLGFTSISESLVPGSNHFGVMHFYQKYPDYQFYWQIEYDVMYNGEWVDFFYQFEYNNNDFLSTIIRFRQDDPKWYWWSYARFCTINIEKEQYLRSFNPIYRLSNRAIENINKFLSLDNCGHHEVFIPTLLYHIGCSLMDIGGNGVFTPPEFYERNYLSEEYLLAKGHKYIYGTMRHKPTFTMDDIKNIGANALYHPFK